MLETIHIFDEFFQPTDEMTPELRHKKRMELEPLVYGILQKKYGSKLEAFWSTHTVPQHTDSYLVLIERRLHPNLAFVLQNAAYFAPSWGIVLLCSDVNSNYCKELCKGKSVDIRPVFQGNPAPAVGKAEYNSFQQNAEFYKSLPGSNLIFLEVDCYFRKPVPEEWKTYDYIAAPYEWDESSVGGGLSFRKKEAMLQICSSGLAPSEAADDFLCKGVKTLGLSTPCFDTAITYIAESCLYEDPVGVHQWWTFFEPTHMEEDIFHSLLSLETH